MRVENLPEDPVGLFYTWWRGDSPEPVEMSPGLAIELDPAPGVIAAFSGLSESEVARRIEQDNRAVVARVNGHAAAFGWSAAHRFEIGELGLDVHLPDGDRYLWDFVTLPEWRGQGIYPALLQAFIAREVEAKRFWVGHDLDNVASRRGILKAGFQTVGEVYAADGAGPVFVARGDLIHRAREAADLLRLPFLVLNDGEAPNQANGTPSV